MKKKRIAILGSTGSIGKQALEVIDALGEQYEIVALSAQKSVELLAGQVILQTVAAGPSTGAGHVRAGAVLGVLVLLAVHEELP